MRFDHVLVRAPHCKEFLADLLVDCALCADNLGAGDFGGLAETRGRAHWVDLVEQIADCRARCQARGGVALAALRRDEKLFDRARRTMVLRRQLQVILGRPACRCYRCNVTGSFNREAGYRLSGFPDPCHDPIGPARLDANHNASGHIWIRAGADERPEEQLQILTELQPSVGVRQSERAFDIVLHRLDCRIRQIVKRQDHEMIPDPHSAVLTAVPVDSSFLLRDGGDLG